MTTEGRGVIGQIQKDLRETQAKLKTLEQLPKDLESLNNRVNEIQAIGQTVQDHDVVLKDLTERVGKEGGGPAAKKGEDWKTYAIGLLAVAFVAMIILWSMGSSQNAKVVAAANQAITKSTADVQAKVVEINDRISRLQSR